MQHRPAARHQAPGAELTELEVRQARDFARARAGTPGLLVHSVARRAAQTAEAIGVETGAAPVEVHGIHEVQAGDLEDRDDDAAIAGVQRDLPALA